MSRIILFFLFVSIISSCTKSGCELDNQSIIGEWQLIEQNVSIGGPSKWESVSNGGSFTLFDDGSYTGTILFPNCQMGSFGTNETELILTPSCETDSDEFIYSIVKDGDTLILSPRTVICTDGCSYKYQRID